MAPSRAKTEYVAWVKHKAGPRSKKLKPGTEAVTLEASSKDEALARGAGPGRHDVAEPS